MDPNATYRLWLEALRNDDIEGASEHYINLHDRISSGGFEPGWEDETHRGFFMREGSSR